jgi:predicted AlkP superfamily phosphohydrolase/phosphomutase/Flp pilus assembly protein TadD
VVRSRFFRTLFWLACIAGTAYLLVSLFLPSSRRLIFGVDKNSGSVRMVSSYVTLLPPHRYYRLTFEKRDGAAQSDGFVHITSKEGVPVTLNYRLRFGISGDRIADARRLVADGWSAWIRARVSEAVAAVTAQVGIEDLVSPTSQFSTRHDLLKRIVAAHLARSGLNVSAFQVSRVEPDRDALLKYKRSELRRSARGVAGRVAIFAIDGADWDLIQELSDDGRVPNLQALIKGGTTGNLQTIEPTVSPLVWTTMATGVTPDRHGVIDFFDQASHAPIDSYARRVPAIWDIAEGFGRHSVVVNWWTAWPPAPSTTAVFDTPVELLENAIYPANIAAKAHNAEVAPSTVGYDQVQRFLHITSAEYDAGVSRPGDPINEFHDILIKTWNDHSVALSMYRDQAPLFFAMTYEGTDVVNHLFAPYHPPQRDGVSADAYRKYWPAVSNYYSDVDRMIGEWMKVLPDDTTVIIVSAHGYKWGKTRPTEPPAGRAALSDHRNPGIFIAYGNHVLASRPSHSISIYDIVPTVLAILGLPQSGEMPGHVPQWAFKDISPVQSVKVVSYSEFFSERPVATPARVDPKEYQADLQAIGHILDPSKGMQPQFEDTNAQDAQTANAKPLPPEQWGAYAYYNNLGIQLRTQNKLKEAIDAFQKAIDLNPNRPAPYLNMAMALFDRQLYTAANEVFLEAVKHGLPNGDQWFCDFAALYRQRNMTTWAINLLQKGKEIYPQSNLIAANLGSALAQADRYSEGVPELERALSLQPSSTLALNNLGILYAKKGDYARALDFWNRSLTIDPRQPQIRAAVQAAETQL